jgi:hypothetical protein
MVPFGGIKVIAENGWFAARPRELVGWRFHSAFIPQISRMIKDVGLNRFAVVLRFRLRFLNLKGPVVVTARHLSLV